MIYQKNKQKNDSIWLQFDLITSGTEAFLYHFDVLH